MTTHDPVNHPDHYTRGGIETIDFIEAKQLDYHVGNAVKYLSRAGHKPGGDAMEDLRKARWYIDRAIAKREEAAEREWQRSKQDRVRTAMQSIGLAQPSKLNAEIAQ